LADALTDTTDVWIDDWVLRREGDHYVAVIAADGFALNLTFTTTQVPLLNGDSGFSQKGPAIRSASYYYSEPHLRVSGTLSTAAYHGGVTGEAWLDHEWSSEYLDVHAIGWDWIGINLKDGGALMAFQIRDRNNHPYWTGATLRDASGKVYVAAPANVAFSPGRLWRSPRTGVTYPVSWRVQCGEREFAIEPLMADQENDARLSSGTVYWEGAVRVTEHRQLAGLGYLELTGYDGTLTLTP
jgi:predicted secreted hydrolase